MSIATRVRGSFAVLVLLLAGVLAASVAQARLSADRARRVTEAAARSSAASGAQLMRLGELRATAAKYGVTRDSGYLRRFTELVDEHGNALAGLRAGTLAPDERAALDQLHMLTGRLEIGMPQPLLDQHLEAMAAATARLAGASRRSLEREIRSAEVAADRARLEAWWVAVAAAGAGIVLASLLSRTLTAPLAHLAAATRAVAGGRFDTRVGPTSPAGDEIAVVQRAFDEMTERLGQLERARQDFVSSVSHDLKAPLASMQATTDALLEGLGGPLTARQQRLLLLSRDSGAHLSAMVGKLLDLARFHPTAPQPFVAFDLVALARDVTERTRAPREQRGPEVAFVTHVARIPVRGNPDALARLLENLLENALHVSPADSRIEVRTTVHGANAYLAVADQGPGVPAGDRERIFGRFHQGATSPAVSGRVGLGLAICRQVAATHGGVIAVRDNHPRGAVFTLEIPIAQAGRGQSTSEAA